MDPQSVWHGRSWAGCVQHGSQTSSYGEAFILIVVSLLLCTIHTETLFGVWAAGQWWGPHLSLPHALCSNILMVCRVKSAECQLPSPSQRKIYAKKAISPCAELSQLSSLLHHTWVKQMDVILETRLLHKMFVPFSPLPLLYFYIHLRVYIYFSSNTSEQNFWSGNKFTSLKCFTGMYIFGFTHPHTFQYKKKKKL